ncbi:X-ray radiation resistance-associated protein 1, partial [Cladochytrium tenue]
MADEDEGSLAVEAWSSRGGGVDEAAGGGTRSSAYSGGRDQGVPVESSASRDDARDVIPASPQVDPKGTLHNTEASLTIEATTASYQQHSTSSQIDSDANMISSVRPVSHHLGSNSQHDDDDAQAARAFGQTQSEAATEPITAAATSNTAYFPSVLPPMVPVSAPRSVNGGDAIVDPSPSPPLQPPGSAALRGDAPNTSAVFRPGAGVVGETAKPARPPAKLRQGVVVLPAIARGGGEVEATAVGVRRSGPQTFMPGGTGAFDGASGIGKNRMEPTIRRGGISRGRVAIGIAAGAPAFEVETAATIRAGILPGGPELQSANGRGLAMTVERLQMLPAQTMPAPLAWKRRNGKYIEVPQLLDGFRLLNSAQASDPDDVYFADVTNQDLRYVVEDDLTMFGRLHTLRAGENPGLPLARVGALPALARLASPMCAVKDLDLDCEGRFEKLEELDLSYNSASAAALLVLSTLPRLRSLDLTANELTTLPERLAGLGAGWRDAVIELLLPPQDVAMLDETLALMGAEGAGGGVLGVGPDKYERNEKGEVAPENDDRATELRTNGARVSAEGNMAGAAAQPTEGAGVVVGSEIPQEETHAEPSTAAPASWTGGEGGSGAVDVVPEAMDEASSEFAGSESATASEGRVEREHEGVDADVVRDGGLTVAVMDDDDDSRDGIGVDGALGGGSAIAGESMNSASGAPVATNMVSSTPQAAAESLAGDYAPPTPPLPAPLSTGRSDIVAFESLEVLNLEDN